MRDIVPSLSHTLGRLYAHLSRRRRVQLFGLIPFMLVGALAELATLGAVLPFLALLAAPDKALEYPLLQQLFNLLGWRSESILLPATLLFGLTAVLAALVRTGLIWAGNKVTYGIGYDLSVEIYRRTLLQPYRYHVAHNSSQILAGMGKAHDLVPNLLIPLINTLTASLLAMAIFVTLIVIDPQVAFATGTLFGLLYLLITLGIRRQLQKNSQIIAKTQNAKIQAIQEGLGGIRDILLDGSQELYVGRFSKVDADLNKAHVANYFIGGAPRNLIEAIGMLFIAVLAYWLSRREGSLAEAIPVLGALAIGAQRLLPLMQQIFHGWTMALGELGNIEDVVELIEQPVPAECLNQTPPTPPMPFERSIELRNIRFRYTAETPNVLDCLNMEIIKGRRIGFIGKTGSGKSTALDLLLGLLEPDSGQILIDGQALTPANRRNWQAHIAHVPQSIYLADTSIAENIAFGVAQQNIDWSRLREAARKAHIAEFIESLAEQYETRIGERGVRLSGGQRQRIGIARALYKQADVLIFDEATSALDDCTENAVMEAIRSLGPELTVLTITHRLSTLSDCDYIFELNAGRLLRVSHYKHCIPIDSSENRHKSHQVE